MFDRTRMMMALVVSGLGLGTAMPGQAQQVVLTPAGSTFSPVVGTPVDGFPASPANPLTDTEREIGDLMRLIAEGKPFTVPPGTGSTEGAPLVPGASRAISTLPTDPNQLPSDEVLVGGYRYGDIRLVNKPEPIRILTEEELRNGMFTHSVGTQTITTQAITTSTTAPIASPAAINTVVADKNTNQNLVLVFPQNNSSPLSTSRILPSLTR
jgi:hypothetical protein